MEQTALLEAEGQEAKFCLRRLPYYHGVLANKSAAELLMAPGVGRGTFLLHFAPCCCLGSSAPPSAIGTASGTATHPTTATTAASLGARRASDESLLSSASSSLGRGKLVSARGGGSDASLNYDSASSASDDGTVQLLLTLSVNAGNRAVHLPLDVTAHGIHMEYVLYRHLAELLTVYRTKPLPHHPEVGMLRGYLPGPDTVPLLAEMVNVEKKPSSYGGVTRAFLTEL